jgi:molecular chaperone GrpE
VPAESSFFDQDAAPDDSAARDSAARENTARENSARESTARESALDKALLTGQQDLVRKLDELNDLFRRRLVEDREKQKAFDALYRELNQSRAIADGQYLVPLIRRLINVVDRLRDSPGDFAPSIADELTEILATYEVEEVRPTLPGFDPSTQEVASVVEAATADDDGTVAGVRRSGWRLGARLLRPVLVDIHRYQDGKQTGRAAHSTTGREGPKGVEDPSREHPLTRP